MAKYLILYRQVAGLVVCGPVRDAAPLMRESWPVWCSGVTPIGCTNTPNKEPLAADKLASHRSRYQGAIAVCDDTGVVIIPPQSITADFLRKLDWIEEQEDLWFDAIDRKKLTTYETVCLRKYEQKS